MSQGYGPQGNDWQQWGQSDPNQQPQGGQSEGPNQQQPQGGQPEDPNQQQPQWGQPDQGQPWGQPSPAPQSEQPQWGQPSPAPQSEQPQWGQPSPAPASDPWGQQSAQPAFGSPGEAGYPGAVGATPQFMPGDGVNWPRVRMLGMSLLIGVALLLLIRLGNSLASFLMADTLATGGEDLGAMALGGSLVTLLLWVANVIVSLAVLVVAIMAAVMGRGKARVGGIVVAVAIPVAVITSWIIGFIVGIVLGISASGDPATAAMTADGYRINAGIDALRVLVMIAIMAFGAWMVFDTAKKKLSA